MVFTVRVRWADEGHSRRAILAATATLAAAGLTGCDLGDPPPRWHPAPDALLPLLAATIRLADRYDATIAAMPALAGRLTPLRDNLRAHVIALAREMGIDERSPAATPLPSVSAGVPAGSAPADEAAALAELAEAEKLGQALAEQACLAAPGFRAALLGSITACRATHMEALR
jgi:hypothetical protein